MGFIQLVGSRLCLFPLMYAVADIPYQTRLVLVSVSSSLLSPLLGT